MSGNEMESERAARLLAEGRTMEQQVARRTDLRAYGVIQVCGAVITSLYIGVFLLTMGNPSMSNLLLLPMLLFSLLIQGAHNRLRVHLRPSGRRLWLLMVTTLVPFLSLAVLNLLSIAYPWWLNLAVVGLVLVVLVGNGMTYVRRSAAASSIEPWTNEPLSTTARKVTVIIGAYLGVAAGAVSHVWFPVAAVLLIMLFFVALVGWRSPWGLARVGSEWGPIHWAAFGLSITFIFAVAILNTHTAWMTSPLPLLAGALVALPLFAAAFITPSHGRS